MRYTLLGLSPNTNYVIRARSKVGPAYSQWSRNFYLLTSSDLLAPKTPANVVGTMSGTSFILTWDAVTQNTDNTVVNDLDHYEVRVSSSGDPDVRIFTTKDTRFELTFQMNMDTFGSPQANVQMQVRSVDAAGNTNGYSSNVSQTNPAPANPTGFVGSAGMDRLQFKWNGVADTDLKEYRIYMGTTSGAQATLVWNGYSTTAEWVSNDYTTDRWFRVVAADAFNSESPSGPVVGPLKPLSPFTVDTTAPSVPTGLAAALAYDSAEVYATATVSWTAVADTANDLASYQIGYRPVGQTDWQYTNVDYTNTSTKIFGLIPYTNYEFRIRSSDFYANYSAWSSTVTATAPANGAPSQPSAPSVSANTMWIQVTVPGTKQAGGAMEGDVVEYEVHASTSTGFTPSTATMFGTIPVGPTLVGSFQVPTSGGGATQTWYVKIIAVDRGGLKSPASNQTTSTPNLIQATNIQDATITNAKIVNLDADKIQAGNGFINNLIVKSTFTLGDGSTTGRIESFGYVAGTTGFRLDKSTFEVNQGSIAAAALKIQDSQNMVPPAYAGMQFVPAFYATTAHLGGINGTPAASTIQAKYENQSLKFEWGTGGTKELYFGTSTTDYNIPVDASTSYIGSIWVYGNGAATTISLKAKFSNGTATTMASNVAIASNTWTRVSGALTTPSGVSGVLMYIDTTDTVSSKSIYVDGLQFERLMAGLPTPSPWKPSSATQIDGGIIRTGEIRSTQLVTVNSVSQPAWSINMSGNAQFGDAAVRGKILVGAAGDPDNGQSFISSGNYAALTTGWKIDSKGDVEFNSGRIRGDLIVDQTLTTNKLAVGVLRNNLISNPGFEDTADIVGPEFTNLSDANQGNANDWRQNLTSSFAEAGVRTGNTRSGVRRGYVRLLSGANTTTDQAELISNAFQVTAGSTYRFTWNASAYGSGVVGVGTRMFAYAIFGSTKTTLSTGNANNQLLTYDDIGAVDYQIVPYTASVDTVSESYTTYSADVTIPGGQTDLWCAFRIYTQGGTPEQYVTIDDVSCYEQGVGGGSELTSAGLRLFSNAGDEVVALVSNRPNYFTVQDGGITRGGISAQGNIFGTNLSIDGDPIFGGEPFFGLYGQSKGDLVDYYPNGRDFDNQPIGLFESLPQGNVAKYFANGSSFGSVAASTQQYHLFNLACDLLPGRGYHIYTNAIWINITGATINNGQVKAFIRRTTDGTEPSATNGTTVAQSFVHSDTGSGGWISIPPVHHRYDNTTNSTVDARFGLFVQPNGCSADIISGEALWMYIDDIGPALANTGTVVNSIYGGSGTPTPPATVKTYVTTWNTNGWATYRSKNGLLRGAEGNVGDTSSKIYQGYSSSGSYNGDQRGLWTFPSVTGTLTGATVTKVEAYIYWDHWYNNSGGTAKIATHNYADGGWPTGSLPSLTYRVSKALGTKSGGMWVTLPSSTYSGFKAGTIKGFGVGPAGSTSTTYYGFADDTTAKLRITYTK